MCGIAGEVRFDSSTVDSAVLSRMANAMLPRGPDAGGIWQQGRVGLAHRRLAIIDLSAHAEQPMIDAELGLSIVFNGCIYNYRELRSELIALGYRFFSQGDTEVLLKAYHAWGAPFVQRLHGMFAFAIIERDSGQLILGRDRFGIKPLYLAPLNSALRFASTLPALLAAGDVDTSLDHVALHHYMSWHAVVPPPYTLLRGVRKLPAATLTTISAEGKRQDWQYWNLQVTPDPALAALPELARADLLEATLSRAVQRRMVSDVPVGVLLSGGVDSSLIVALLAELGQTHLATFSIGFESMDGLAGDEFIYSDLVAREYGTQHHKIEIDSQALLAALPQTIAAMSEPMISADNVAFFLLSQYVAKTLKVVQSGQGADEVFAGYHWHPLIHAASDIDATFAQLYFDRDHSEFKDVLHPSRIEADYSRAFTAAYFAKLSANAPLNQSLQLETLVMLPDDPVKRVDNMTMAWGLEARTPFLDHELVEFAARLPLVDKIGAGGAHDGKALLKTVARRRLPKEVIDRPKGYFPVPLINRLSGATLSLAREALLSPVSQRRQLFSKTYIDNLLKNPDAHITPLKGSKLWQLALLELWLQAQGIT